ncbi:serine hydrolase domain-containing protein [Pontibacter cellulosilyticus]|uniref:Beta-lactamase family protein n=1 Tax=Pontibacter cellulosilyticus TaxID=1720253 RepID=A0A923SJ85_9BACT|nr:serine hydrolase domain-containing protein [Pontibacter cellulosilyticus]MBC5992456.1 beta-lactamase family protein [Pontibacter cellulosilyticus]
MKRNYFTLLLVLLVCFSAVAQSTATLQKQLFQHFHEKAYPGILIGYSNGQHNISQALGYTNTATKQYLKPDQLMISGSTGKIVVAAAALKLVQEKKLELDAPVSKYLKGEWAEAIPNYDCLTVRHLMQHRTGLARYIFTNFKEDVKQDPDKVWQPLEQVKYITAVPPKFGCGQGFAYSDTNYLILGVIIEKVSGQDFYTYAEQNILKPNNIKTFVPTTKRTISGLANGYAGEKDPVDFTGPALDKDGKSRYNLQFEWTGGGYAYSPVMMARLMIAIFEGKVFGKELLAEYTATLPAPEINAEYGLGLMKYNLNGKTLYGHSGFFPGYLAQVYYDPETKESFVFMINTTEPAGIQDLYKSINSFFAQR